MSLTLIPRKTRKPKFKNKSNSREGVNSSLISVPGVLNLDCGLQQQMIAKKGKKAVHSHAGHIENIWAFPHLLANHYCDGWESVIAEGKIEARVFADNT